jgi:uncharacterized FlaG/YvyC family protein
LTRDADRWLEATISLGRNTTVEIGKITSIGELMAIQLTAPVSPQERQQRQQLIKAVESINSANLLGESSELTFAYGRQDRMMRLQVVNRKSKEVLREVPSDDVLRLANGSSSTIAFVGKLSLG